MGERKISFEEGIGRALLDWGFVTDQQLEQAQQFRHGKNVGLLDTLMSLGFVSKETVVTVLVSQLKLPVVTLNDVQVNPQAVKLVPEEYARQHRTVPVDFGADGSLLVVTIMPSDQLLSYISSVTSRNIKFALASGEALDELIDRVYTT